MIKVSRHQTAPFYDGDLEIRTVSIEYFGSSQILRVWFSVLIRGWEFAEI